MIVLDCQSFLMISDRGFEDSLHATEPIYNILPRLIFADKIIPTISLIIHAINVSSFLSKYATFIHKVFKKKGFRTLKTDSTET